MRTKKFLCSSFVIAAVLVASGFFFSQPATAATIDTFLGSPSLAAEKISPTADYNVNTGANIGKLVVVYHDAAVPILPIGQSLTVTLTNGYFAAGSTLSVCDAGVLGKIYGQSAVLSANTSSVVIPITTATVAGPLVAGIQSDGCHAFVSPLTNLWIKAGTKDGTTVTMAVSAPAAYPEYNAAPGVLLAVVNQFSAALSSVTSWLDFNTVATSFLASGTALPYTPDTKHSDAAITLTSLPSNAIIVPFFDSIPVSDGTTCQGRISNGDVFSFVITGGLTGISNIVYGPVGTPTATYTVLPADVLAGSATFNVSGDQALICMAAAPSTPSALGLVAAAPASYYPAIATGTRTLTASILGGGDIPAGYKRPLLGPAPGWTFNLSAKQYYIPIISTVTGGETYIKFQSDAPAAPYTNGVNASILCKDGTVVTAKMGTITPGIPFVVTGAQLAAAAAAQGETVNASAGFAAIFMINTPEVNTFGAANYCDGTGCRNVAVEVYHGNILW